jgi:hypothetical protein
LDRSSTRNPTHPEIVNGHPLKVFPESNAPIIGPIQSRTAFCQQNPRQNRGRGPRMLGSPRTADLRSGCGAFKSMTKLNSSKPECIFIKVLRTDEERVSANRVYNMARAGISEGQARSLSESTAIHESPRVRLLAYGTFYGRVFHFKSRLLKSESWDNSLGVCHKRFVASSRSQAAIRRSRLFEEVPAQSWIRDR